MQIEAGKIGSVGAQSAELVAGKLVVSASIMDGPVTADLKINVDGKIILDALIANVPAGLAQDLAKALEAALIGA